MVWLWDALHCGKPSQAQRGAVPHQSLPNQMDEGAASDRDRDRDLVCESRGSEEENLMSTVSELAPPKTEELHSRRASVDMAWE